MKKKIESTELAIVKPTALPTPTVQPKMSKADIIEAMVERAKRKHEEEKAEYDARQDALMKDLLAAGIEAITETLKAGTEIEAKVSLPYNRDEKYAEIEIMVKTERVKQIVKSIRGLDNPGWFGEKETREQIKKAMDGKTDRVNLILSNQDNVDTIDKLLKKIFTKKD